MCFWSLYIIPLHVCAACNLGVNAWSAQSSDFDQYLIIDLGQPMNVTGIASQGRAHGTEYVLEYAISYGSNGLDYADYKDSGGNVKVRIVEGSLLLIDVWWIWAEQRVTFEIIEWRQNPATIFLISTL